MATTLTQTHPLLTQPFSAATDFTLLADYCEQFVETALESDDPALKMALCARLNTCLRVLEPGLLEPIPDHLKDSFTADTLPVDTPRFEPGCIELCGYCLALTRTLARHGVMGETEQQLTRLLFDLVNYFTAEMKAPRWVRTAQGVQSIDDVLV